MYSVTLTSHEWIQRFLKMIHIISLQRKIDDPSTCPYLLPASLCMVPKIKLKGCLGEEIFYHLQWIYERQRVGERNSEGNNERGL